MIKNNYKKVNEFYSKFKYLFIGYNLWKIILIKSILYNKLIYKLNVFNNNNWNKYEIEWNKLLKNILRVKRSFCNEIIKFDMGLLNLDDIIRIKRFRLKLKCRELGINSFNEGDLLLDNYNNMKEIKRIIWFNRILKMKYHKSWKMRMFINNWMKHGDFKYLKRIKKYLEIDNGILLKLRGYCNGLKRYHYVCDSIDRNKSEKQ